MDRVYNICMLIGFSIPLLTLIFGELGDLFDGLFDGLSGLFDSLDIDLDFDIDIGDASFSIFPFSIQSICAGLLVFGGVGKMVNKGDNMVFANVVAAAVGYLIAILIQTLIRRLKKVEHTTYKKEELMLFDAKVVNTIVAGGFGSISVSTYDGITSTYPAKAEDKKEALRQGTVVEIIRFEKNVAIVRDKKSLEKKYDAME